MEFVTMPMWANICFVIAVLGLIALYIGPKVVKMNMNMDNVVAADTATKIKPKTAYYAVTTTLVVALGIVLCVMSHAQTSGGVLIAYGVICVFGALAAGMACEEGKEALLTVGAIVAIALMVATLVFAEAAYAAIWVASLALVLFIGHLLFPNPKEKK